jgi:hypothetical protein
MDGHLPAALQKRLTEATPANVASIVRLRDRRSNQQEEREGECKHVVIQASVYDEAKTAG